tara:strand:+ start:120 stop:1007 length:888 start_codon:yes stop_codon:yes gene_type:complete
MKFCLIYNKNSSNGKKSKFINQIYKKIQKFYSIDIFETRTEQEASQILKNLKKNNYTRLVLAGGDGTVSFAINELAKNNNHFLKNFAIGYIPTGTANILRFELNINKKIDEIVKTLTSNNIKKTNLIAISDQYSLLMTSIGWDADIIDSVKFSLKKKLGKIIFLIKAIQKFIFMKKFNFKITTEDTNYYASWLLCCNSKYYAGNYMLNKSDIFNDKFKVYIVKEFNRRKLINIIFAILFFKDISKVHGITSINNKKIIIEKIDKHIPVQLDGSFIGNFDKIEISSSDKSVNLLTN